jgi:hypothetical protein
VLQEGFVLSDHEGLLQNQDLGYSDFFLTVGTLWQAMYECFQYGGAHFLFFEFLKVGGFQKGLKVGEEKHVLFHNILSFSKTIRSGHFSVL